MDSLEKEEKFIIPKIEKLLNLLEENYKKENIDEKAIKKLEDHSRRLEKRKQKIEESKKELSRRQEEIKDKEHRENHQINIIEPGVRMMKEINANGYNVQLSVDTESEIIINPTIESDSSDNHQFSKQHQNTVRILGEDEQREYLADGGYMFTETIDFVEKAKVNAYINDSREIETIPKPEKLLERGKTITSEFFTYSKGSNEYSCLNQRQVKEIKLGVYQSADCSGCIIKHLRARKNKLRRITRSEFTERKELMRKKIKQSPEKMNQRKVVERVFGNIKWNLGFRRFSRKGFEGVSIEIMMIALALNLKKSRQIVLFPEKLVQTGLFLLIDLLIGLHRKYKLSLRTVY